MADSKISTLPASTTPLAGTEVLPIVQSSTTRQVSVANLTAGRAISATQLTLITGNLIVASGQGIDFSATAGTGTSELFNDYEEGTWTPDLLISGANTGIIGTQTGKYTKVGRQVEVECSISLTSKGARTGAVRVGGLPYTPAIDILPATVVPTGTWALLVAGGSIQAYISGTAVYLLLGTLTGTTGLTDSNLSNTSAFTFTAIFSV